MRPLVMMMKTIKSFKEKQPLIRTTTNNIQGQMLGLRDDDSNFKRSRNKFKMYNNTVLTVYHEKAQNF